MSSAWAHIDQTTQIINTQYPTACGWHFGRTHVSYRDTGRSRSDSWSSSFAAAARSRNRGRAHSASALSAPDPSDWPAVAPCARRGCDANPPVCGRARARAANRMGMFFLFGGESGFYGSCYKFIFHVGGWVVCWVGWYVVV